MIVTYSYSSLASVTFQLSECEILDRLQHSLQTDGSVEFREGASQKWDIIDWWDDDAQGLTIELICKIETPEKGAGG